MLAIVFRSVNTGYSVIQGCVGGELQQYLNNLIAIKLNYLKLSIAGTIKNL